MLTGRTSPTILAVLDHPAQHFAASFRATAASGLFRFVALYGSSKAQLFDVDFDRNVTWDTDLLSGYEWEEIGAEGVAGRLRRFRQLVRQFNPDVVVCFGWTTPSARLAMVWCAITRTPIVFYSDATWQHSANPRMRRLRRLLLGYQFRRAAGALSTGTFNREFYIYNGMEPERVFESVCPVDTDAYGRASHRRTAATPQRIVVGFAGKLTRRKGVHVLLDALAHVRDDPRWEAVIIGDGPERPSLEAQRDRLHLTQRVRFCGFVNTSEMPDCLAKCDIVVVPSIEDMRVLVATEAMATGAAVIVSSATAVWGKGDLVEDGVSGRIFPTGDACALAAVLREMFSDPVGLSTMQEEAARRAANQGPAAFRVGLEQMVVALIGT